LNSDSDQIRKPTTWLAITSLILGVLSLLVFPSAVLFFHPRPVYIYGPGIALIPAILGFAIGVAEVSRRSKQRMRTGISTAWIAVILTFAMSCLSLLLSLILYSGAPNLTIAFRQSCATNMANLGTAIISYAEKNDGNFPDPAKWCDQLLGTEQVDQGRFLCLPDYRILYLLYGYQYPRAEKGNSHYAMNVNCRGDSSPDTVLLFETSLGWNKHGGPELLSIENHGGGGCNILFRDGHAAYERRPLELNWGDYSNQRLQ
jgi:prepilin-type processing-associated H-X9-DG protein